MTSKTRICSIEGCGKPHWAYGWCVAHQRRFRRHGHPLAGRTFEGTAQAWLETHKNFSGDECLIWPFKRNWQGYARMYHEGKQTMVSRLICVHRRGPPPTPKHEAAHSCGKGHLGCVNGSHLRWATRKENHADMLIHGTHGRGERNSTAKLTEADVLAIRALRAATGLSQSKIARRYGVTRAAVCDIVIRRSWAWL